MQKASSYPLDSLGAREHGAVNGINNWSRADHAAAKVSPVKSLDSILSSLNTVELEVDVALAVWVEGDVHDVAVLLLGFGANVVLELFLPILPSLPVIFISFVPIVEREIGSYSAGSNIFLRTTHLLAVLTLTGSGFISFGLATGPLLAAATGSSVLASFLIKASLE